MSGRSKSVVLTVAVCLLFFSLSVGRVESQDVRVSVSPDVLVPLSDAELFGIGGGGTLAMDVELWNFFAPYAGFDVRYILPVTSELENPLFLATGGGGLGVFAYPLSRLRVGLSGGSGVYYGAYTTPDGDVIPTGNVFWKAGLDAGYRISPDLTISAGARYIDLLNRTASGIGSFYRGISISLVAQIGFSSGTSEGQIVLRSAEARDVFPVVSAGYAKDPFGTVTIRNAESAEIRNVEVWFNAEGYTSGPVLCGRVAYLPKGADATAPLLASFSDQVMAVTENVRVRGEIRIDYLLLGEPRSASIETTMTILNRNALAWTDPRKLSSFASSTDPAVLDVGKFMAGVVRAKARTEIDSNLQYALGMFEGLRLAGISYSPDPQTPYSAMNKKSSGTDYIQFPFQTIAYRSGDSDDLAVLYASALESVGVPSALIPLDGEVLAAFRMSKDESATRSSFSEAGDFIFIDGQAWVPVRVSLLREGFLRAWSEGATAVRQNADARDKFYTLEQAWRQYPPVGVPGIDPVTKKPSEEQVRTAFDTAISLVVDKEVGPRADKMRSSFGSGGGNGRQRNSLGVLYARYGLYTEALTEFQAAAKLGYDKAAVNIGNVAFLIGDHETAAAWFRKAVDANPSDVAAIIGLARSLYELDLYAEADLLFKRASDLVPELAKQYGYLSASLTGTTARASAVVERGGGMIWDE